MPSIDAELTQHAAFLTALARRLTSSGDEAEDLVQDAYVAALQRGPSRIDEPRPWLAKVLRRGASRARRSNANRSAREQEVARPGGSAEGPAEEIELGQRLLEHVRALEAPYRDVLFQRYYEGLMPKEIAERSGYSTATVKTRLARALAKMRERMDADDPRGREAWFGVAAVLGGGGGSPVRATGVAAAGAYSGGLMLASLVAALLAVSAGLLAWFMAGGVRGTAREAQPDLVRQIESPEPGVSMAQVDRNAAESAARVPGDVTGSSPAPSGVGGVVLDLQGDPVPGATVRVHWRDQTLPEEETVADELGRFHFADHSEARWFKASLSGWHFLNMAVPGRLPLDETRDAVILMTRLGTLHVEAIHTDGSPAEDLPVSVIADGVGLFWPGFAPFADTGAGGIARDGRLTLEVPAGMPLLVGAASARLDVHDDGDAARSVAHPTGAPIVVAPGSESHLRIVVLTDVEVHGTVVGPDGDPVRSTALEFQIVRPPGGGWGTTLPKQTTTDDLGRFVVRVPSVNEVETLRITGTAQGKQAGGTGHSVVADQVVELRGTKPRDVTVTMIPEPLGKIGGDALEPRLEERKRATLELSVTTDDRSGPLWGEVRFIRFPSESGGGIPGERLSSSSFRHVESGEGLGWAEIGGLPGAVVETRPVRSYKAGAKVEVALEPGLYWIGILGDTFVRRGMPVPLTRVETGLVRVTAGEHAIEVSLEPAVIWHGRVIQAVGSASISRPFVAVCDAAGRPMTLGTTHVEDRFHAVGWRGCVYIKGVPPGEHEVWIGTRAELEAGTPRVRRRVLFEGQRSEAVVRY